MRRDSNSVINLPLAEADHADLEYPWTLTMNVMKFVGKIRKLKVIDRALTPTEVGRTAGLDIPANIAKGCAVSVTKENFEATDARYIRVTGIKPAPALDTPSGNWKPTNHRQIT